MESKVLPSITQDRIQAYAEASGDFNPIHLDETFAKNSGLPSTIGHGMLSMGLVGQSLLDSGLTINDMASFECKFKNIVPVGSRLVVAWESQNEKTRNFRLFNEATQEDVATGTVKLK